MMKSIVNTVFVAFCGGLIGIKSKLPAGGLIGAMLAVGFIQIYGLEVRMPVEFRQISEIIIGGFIGLSFTGEFAANLRSLIIPALLISGSVLVFGIVMGFLIHKITGLDLVTAIFAGSPGGITNMTIISNSLGADSRVVAAMQLVRLICLILGLPIACKYLLK